MIKVTLLAEAKLVNSEAVWVRRFSINTGVICNLPCFSTSYKYNDIIQFDPKTFEAIRVIKNGGFTRTRFVSYKAEFLEARSKWERKGYVVEGVGSGVLCIAKMRSKRQTH